MVFCGWGVDKMHPFLSFSMKYYHRVRFRVPLDEVTFLRLVYACSGQLTYL